MGQAKLPESHEKSIESDKIMDVDTEYETNLTKRVLKVINEMVQQLQSSKKNLTKRALKLIIVALVEAVVKNDEV